MRNTFDRAAGAELRERGTDDLIADAESLTPPRARPFAYLSLFLGVVGLFLEFALVIVAMTQLPIMDGPLIGMPAQIFVAIAWLALSLGAAGVGSAVTAMYRREGVGLAIAGFAVSTVAILLVTAALTA